MVFLTTNLIAISWAVFVIAQIADVLTTNKILSQGGRELNPVVAKLMDWFGGAWWVAKLAGAIGIAYALHIFGGHWVMLAVGLLTGAVAANNYRQIR